MTSYIFNGWAELGDDFVRDVSMKIFVPGRATGHSYEIVTPANPATGDLLPFVSFDLPNHSILSMGEFGEPTYNLSTTSDDISTELGRIFWGTGNETVLLAVTLDEWVTGSDDLTFYIPLAGDLFRPDSASEWDDFVGLVDFSSDGTITSGPFRPDVPIDFNGLPSTQFTHDDNLQLAPDVTQARTGRGDDIVLGHDGDDLIVGGKGDDTLEGSLGRDTIKGGGGDDSLRGGDDDDRVIGGGGNDFIDDFTGNSTLIGGGGKDTINGGRDDDRILGGGGKDRLDGESGGDSLNGGGGRDIVKGGGGSDVLEGGGGRDRLVGGGGRDTVDGSTGNDVLIGNGGADTFVFSSGADVVRDFGRNDRIDVGDMLGESFIDLFDRYVAQVGDDVVIRNDRGDTLTLLDVNVQTLDGGDFLI